MGETEVTRDEARKLLGGYATGSLTEAERKLLFDAALDDQDLFDELANEQVLKELIEEPGARARLTAALEPRRPQRAWWPWAAGLAVAGLATLGVWIAQRPAPPQEIASNQPTATRNDIAKDVAEPVTPDATIENAAPSSAPKAAAAPPEKAVNAPAAVRDFKAVPENPALRKAAPTEPSPAPAAPAVGGAVAVQELAAPKQVTPVAAPQAADQAVSARSGFVANAAAPVGYLFIPGGKLRVTASATAGMLEVRSGQDVLFERARIEPQTPVEISVPADVRQVRLEFTIPAQQPFVINVPVPR